MQSCSECTDAHNSRALLRIRPDVRHAPCAFPAQGRLRPQWSAHTHPVYNNVAGPPDPRLCRFRRRDSLLQASWHCGGLFPLKPFTSALFLVLVRTLQQPPVLSDHLASEPVLQQQIAGAKAQRTSSIPRGTVLSVRPLPRPLYSVTGNEASSHVAQMYLTASPPGSDHLEWPDSVLQLSFRPSRELVCCPSENMSIRSLILTQRCLQSIVSWDDLLYTDYLLQWLFYIRTTPGRISITTNERSALRHAYLDGHSCNLNRDLVIECMDGGSQP